ERSTIRAAEPEGPSAAINAEDFVRVTVIMGKGIHAVSPRIAPVVLSKTFFKKGSGILPVHRVCPSIDQQRQNAVRNSAVILKSELLRLDDLLLLDHVQAL